MNKTYTIGILLGITLFAADASENCMDNSKHGDTCDGYDYKKYYYVGDCDCPCERYAHSYKRNRCERCLHFNVDRSRIQPFLVDAE